VKSAVSALRKRSVTADMSGLALLRAEYEMLSEADLKVLYDDGALWLHQRAGGVRETEAEYLELIRRQARYVLDEVAVEQPVESNDGSGETEMLDLGNGGMRLEDFWAKPQARASRLSLDECAALRLYTSAAFRLINGPLRSRSSVKLLERQCHPLALTTALISSAIKKLRAYNMQGHKFQCRYLWRGMKNRDVKQAFRLKGGAEMACMSTSASLDVVASYARSSAPLIFRLRVDSPMEMGASIAWISMFPGEAEVVFPPLTFLKPMFAQRIKDLPQGEVITLKASFPS